MTKIVWIDYLGSLWESDGITVTVTAVTNVNVVEATTADTQPAATPEA